MTGASLVVDPADGHLTIFKARVTKNDLAARVLGFRHFVRERYHRPAEYRRINAVVDERSAQRDLPPRIACRRSKGGEIPRQHRSSGHKSDQVGRILPNPCSLISTEEEQF